MGGARVVLGDRPAVPQLPRCSTTPPTCSAPRTCVAGAAVDGLLLLRAPARDWLLRGDTRVWDVLHTVATGLAASGDVAGAARLVGGDRRPTPHLRPRIGTTSAPVTPRGRPQRRGSSHGTNAPAASSTWAPPSPRHWSEIEALARIRLRRDPGRRRRDLTARQQDVAALVARGLTNKQIAQRLGISRFTAETHVRNILDRLGAASRSEIATWAARSRGR